MARSQSRLRPVRPGCRLVARRDLFTGKSGEHAVISHLLMRRLQVAAPEVDIGDDLLVAGDLARVPRVQVKTSRATEQRNFLRRPIPTSNSAGRYPVHTRTLLRLCAFSRRGLVRFRRYLATRPTRGARPLRGRLRIGYSLHATDPFRRHVGTMSRTRLVQVPGRLGHTPPHWLTCRGSGTD